MSASGNWKNFYERESARLLLLLFGGDLFFGAMHFFNHRFAFLRLREFNLERDQSYPERFQYLKFFMCAALLAHYSVRASAWRYLAWSSMFAFFLLDDSLRVHETLGSHIATRYHFESSFGLRAQDYGELVASAVAAISLVLPLAWAYRTGDSRFRRLSHDIVLLVSSLLFFGILIDMVHVAVAGIVSQSTNFMLGMLEDLGEMVVASLLVWYVFFMFRRNFDSPSYLLSKARH